MKCPKCGNASRRQQSTVDTQDAPDQMVRRRRECRECQTRWSTLEITEDQLKAIKEEGRPTREDKALMSLARKLRVLVQHAAEEDLAKLPQW